MEVSHITPDSERTQWRAGFRKRIKAALEYLQGETSMSRRHERHFQGFAKVLSENVAFEKEVRKLSPFEFEVLCISSTELQLRDGLIYFAANEVTATLLLGILKDDRREEVRDKLSRTVNPRVLSVYDHMLLRRTVYGIWRTGLLAH